MSAESQPGTAAILETLNEIKRELAESRGDRTPPPIHVRPMKLVEGEAHGAALPPPLGESERRHTPPERRRSRSVRIGLGIAVAVAYVGILAAAAVVVSEAVWPQRDGGNGTIALMQHDFAAIAGKLERVVTRAGGNARDSAMPAPTASPAASTVALPASTPTATESPHIELPSVREAESPLPSTLPAETSESPPAPSTPTAEASPPAPPSIEAPAPAVAAKPLPVVPDSREASAEPAAAPPQQAPATAAIAATPPASDIPAALLRARGDERLKQGDIASARLFYERAAKAGDAVAARRAGDTFDPALLERWGVQGMRGDVAQAATWYRRAHSLGDGEAEQRLRALPPQ